MDLKWIYECFFNYLHCTPSRIKSSSFIHSRKNSLFVQVCNSVYLLSCVIGFLYQISMISSEYFSFQVSSDLFIQIPVELHAPDTSICVRYSDVFNVKKYSKSNGINIKEEIGSTSLKYKLGKIVTIQDIFNYTPSVKDVIASCLIRLPDSYGYKIHHSRKDSYDSNCRGCHNQCEELFDVNKFYIQDEVCYMFTLVPSQNISYKYHNLGSSLSKPGVFYKIALTDPFNATKTGKVVIHKSTWTPFTSISFAPSFNTLLESFTREWRHDLNNKFWATYTMFSQQRLPAPFASNCLDYRMIGMRSRSLCIKDCITKSTIDKFGLVPFSTLSLEPIKRHHITTLYLYKNSTAEKVLDSLEYQCKLKCHQVDCNNTYFMTKMISSLTSIEQDGLSFVITAPRSASYIITNSPSSSLTEFLVYVSSCLGIWFGFSFMDLNPFSMNGTKLVKSFITSLENSFRRIFYQNDPRMKRENLITRNYQRRQMLRIALEGNPQSVNEPCHHIKIGQNTECNYCLETSRLIRVAIKGETTQYRFSLREKMKREAEMKEKEKRKKCFCF